MKLNLQIVMIVLISAAHVGIGIWLLHYAPAAQVSREKSSSSTLLVSINLNLVVDKLVDTPSKLMPQSSASTLATMATKATPARTAQMQVSSVITTLALPLTISSSDNLAELSAQSALLPVSVSASDASQVTQVAATPINIKASSPPKFDIGNLNNPAPHYPSLAKRLGEQGRVILRVLVNAAGQPQRVEMHTSSGSARLDIAAIEAVKHWQFIPAREGNINVDGVAIVPINFQLS
jgi:periplasmic protein TonB